MRGRTLLWALLGPLLAMLAGEAVLRSAWWDRQVLRTHAGSPAHARALLRTRPDARVGVIGSSVALIDVRPKQLEQRLGRPVVNAGVLASPVSGTWMFSSELLETNIELFVLVVAASDLATEVPLRRMRIVEPRLAVQLFGWLHVARHRDRYLDWTLGAASVSWRQRNLPRELWSADDGVHPRDKPRDPHADVRALTLRERHAELQWSVDGPNVRALRLLAGRIEAEGRELVVVPAPQDPRITGEPVRREVLGLLAELSREEPFELVVPSRWPVWKPEHFRDAVHLLRPGQEAFTSGLASALERRR